jgi:hypothetical protein
VEAAAGGESLVGREIRAGELLAEMKVRGERQKAGDVGTPKSRKKKDGSALLPSLPPRLSDLGVSKTQSSRWQQLAALPLDRVGLRQRRRSPMDANKVATFCTLASELLALIDSVRQWARQQPSKPMNLGSP